MDHVPRALHLRYRALPFRLPAPMLSPTALCASRSASRAPQKSRFPYRKYPFFEIRAEKIILSCLSASELSFSERNPEKDSFSRSIYEKMGLLLKNDGWNPKSRREIQKKISDIDKKQKKDIFIFCISQKMNLFKKTKEKRYFRPPRQHLLHEASVKCRGVMPQNARGRRAEAKCWVGAPEATGGRRPHTKFAVHRFGQRTEIRLFSRAYPISAFHILQYNPI